MKLTLYISALLVCGSVLFGCARPAAPAQTQAPAKVSETQAPVASVSVTNAGESTAALSPSPARLGSLQADSARSEPEQALVPTLCAPSERVLFACAMKGSTKAVALCASKDVAETRGYLYYAYGTAEHPELVYPARKSPPTDRFKRTHLSFAGNTGGYAYSFANGGVKYIIYAMSGADGLAEHGLMVSKSDSRTPMATHVCREPTVVESGEDDLIDLTLSWNEDAAISRQGLPGRN